MEILIDRCGFVANLQQRMRRMGMTEEQCHSDNCESMSKVTISTGSKLMSLDRRRPDE